MSYPWSWTTEKTDLFIEGTSIPAATSREHRIMVRCSHIAAVEEFYYRHGPDADLLTGTRIRLKDGGSFELRQGYDDVVSIFAPPRQEER